GKLCGQGKPLRALAAAPGRPLLAGTANDGRVLLWDSGVADSAPLRTWAVSPRAISRLAFRADGKRLASAGEDRLVHICEPETGGEVGTFAGLGGAVADVCLLGENGVVSCGPELRYWDLPPGGEARAWPAHDDRGAAAVASLGRLVVTGGADGNVNT